MRKLGFLLVVAVGMALVVEGVAWVAFSLPDGAGYSDTSGYPQPISVKAGNVTAGDTKHYQCWYRNIVASPCGNDFNASNGYAVTWAP